MIGIGAANRTRTCDPVITNDVLYQLSYCGGPNAASGQSRKRPHLISGTAPIGKKNAAVRNPEAFSSEVGTDSRRENASKQESRVPFRCNRNGKGSSCCPSVTKIPASRRPGPWADRFVPRIRPARRPHRPRGRRAPGRSGLPPESALERPLECPAATGTAEPAGLGPIRRARGGGGLIRRSRFDSSHLGGPPARRRPPGVANCPARRLARGQQPGILPKW